MDAKFVVFAHRPNEDRNEELKLKMEEYTSELR